MFLQMVLSEEFYLARPNFRNVIVLTEIRQVLVELLDPIAVRLAGHLCQPFQFDLLCLLEKPPLRWRQAVVVRQSESPPIILAFLVYSLGIISGQQSVPT